MIINSSPSTALPLNSCEPTSCPAGYSDDGTTCSNGICTKICTIGVCGDTFTTVSTQSVYLPNEDYNGDSEDYSFDIGTYTPTDTSKCYRFRQTTPSNFIRKSDIDDNEGDSDSGSAIFWISRDGSHWYNNQGSYCSGGNSQFNGVKDNGAIWIDNGWDSGNDFRSADSLSNTKSLHCAPNQGACDAFNGNCDTDCYGSPISLRMGFEAELSEEEYGARSKNKFCNAGPGDDNPHIDILYFERQTVYMYVDEFDLVVSDSDNQQCEYWPQCNPADPCCSSNGKFKSGGSVCKSAHDSQCTGSSSCTGIAFEDRCTGSSSSCPDNNFEISFAQACNQVVCAGQSCSGSNFQSEKTCNAGVCQGGAAQACPNNMGCKDATTCKSLASSTADCKADFEYDPLLGICWSGEGESRYDLKYDNNGNLLSGLGYSYVYNSFNQLVSIKNINGRVIEEYTYDHSGNRKKKTEHHADGTNTKIYYQGNFIQIVNSSGTFIEKYYYLNEKLVAKKVGGETLFLHPDQLSSTRLITDSNGNKVADINYEPFGNLEDNSERLLYTGKELDGSGLNYFGARYQDPRYLLTFTQPDVNIPDIYNPQDLNRYTYVRNNPYKYNDPSGETPWDAVDVVFIGLDAKALYDDPSLANVAWLGLSVVSLLPLLPNVAGYIRHGDGALDSTGKFFNRMDKVSDTQSLINKASKQGFAPGKLKTRNHRAHAREFGLTPENYEKAAKNFLSSKNPDILTHIRTTGDLKGDIVRFNPTTKEFSVASNAGYVKTYYKPKRGMDYYRDQIKEHGGELIEFGT